MDNWNIEQRRARRSRDQRAQERRQRARELKAQGKGVREIAETLGLATRTVGEYLQVVKTSLVREPKPPPANPKAEKIQRLKDEGLGNRDIAERVGISPKQVSVYLRDDQRQKRGPSVNGQAWKAFILSRLLVLDSEAGKQQYVNFLPLTKHRQRRVYGWQRGESKPDFFTASDFCDEYGMNIEEFVDYCRERDLQPFDGEEPDWYI